VPSSERLVRILLDECGTASRVLELYYWSREPGMRDIIRHIAEMPESARSALEVFVALAGDPKSVTADLNGAGALTLASPSISKTAALVRYMAENETDEPAILN
jgi:hypothetical protein